MEPSLERGELTKNVVAGVAFRASQHAVDKIGDALDNFEHYIHRGSEGIRTLSFVGGLVQVVLGLCGIINILAILTSPFAYLMNVAQTFFGCVIVLVDAHPSFIDRYEKLAFYQQSVFRHCNFLAIGNTKGLFYVYVGVAAISLYGLSLLALVGAYIMLMGIFVLACHYGYDVDKPTSSMIAKIHVCLEGVRTKWQAFRNKNPNEPAEYRGGDYVAVV